MTDQHDVEDRDIGEQAVKALSLATERAMEAGLPQVLVQDGQLVRIDGGKVTVIKQLPPKVKVADLADATHDDG